MRDDWKRCRAQASIVRPRLGRELLEPLVTAGIEPMVIKGSAVEGRYPERGLRPMDDVDLLVRSEQHREAAEVLRRAGWRTTRRQGPPYSLSLAHPAVPGLPVDLHLELTDKAEQSFRFTAADLWQSARNVALFDVPVLVPDPESEIVLVATHAAKPFHNFDRLLWAVDAAVIIGTAASRGEAIDWNQVGATARRAGAGSALAVVLAQASRLGAQSPESLHSVQGGTARQRVLDRPRSLTWPVESIGRAERDRLTYAVIDDTALRMRRLVHDITRDGLLHAPARAPLLAWRILRRTRRLRANAMDSSDADLMVERPPRT